MGKIAKKHKLERGGASSKHDKTSGHGHKSAVSDSGQGVSSGGSIEKHKKNKKRYNKKKTPSPAASSSSSKSSHSNSSSRSPSSQSQASSVSSSATSNGRKGRMLSKISNTKELSEQQKRSKWESPEFQRKRSNSQSQQRSAEHAGGYNRDRDRERESHYRNEDREAHYRNGERGGHFDRKRGHGGAKISERREQQSERDRSRDRVGQNRYDDRRGAFDKRKSSADRDIVHGNNRRERFDDNRQQERRGRSHSRSPRRDRNNESNRYRGRGDDEARQQQKQYQRGDRRQRYEPKRRRFNNEGNDDKNYEWGKRSPGDFNDKKRQRDDTDKDNEPPADKEKINFGLSGALTEDANKVNGVIVKYAEPPEARKPKRHWRLYPFKGETSLPTLHIHRQSCFLVGRDRKVVDLAVDHPSCSKQHAALQYRLVPFQREDGSKGKRVRLYVIDLESANGTFLNNQKIEARKYYELIERDVIKFGFSSREYVLLHENSKDDKEDDDVYVKDEPEEKVDVPKL